MSTRRDGAERVALAGGLFGAAAGASRIKVRGARPLGQVARQAWKDRKAPADAKRSLAAAAGKTTVKRGLQVTAIPLAAGGAADIRRPTPERGRVDLRREVIRPVLHGATGADLMLGSGKVKKSQVTMDLTDAERKKLVRRKRQAVGIASASGALGIAAGVTRAPQGVRALSRISPKVAASATGRRIAAAEPKLTSASNTLGVGSIAVGSAGAFNAAGMQRREARALAKSARYMRANADRVSPQAEDAYHRLRNDRNAGYGGAILNGTASAAGVDYTRDAFQRGRKAWGGLGIAMTAASGIAASSSYKGARRKQVRMDKIEAKARSRKAAGLYGAGRGRTPVDPSSTRANLVAKAGVAGIVRAASASQVKPHIPGLPKPTGVARALTPRRGTIRRVPGGGAVTVRGGLG